MKRRLIEVSAQRFNQYISLHKSTIHDCYIQEYDSSSKSIAPLGKKCKSASLYVGNESSDNESDVDEGLLAATALSEMVSKPSVKRYANRYSVSYENITR